MNYQYIHDQIIANAKQRIKPSTCVERHHIIPRSLGGSNEVSNLVYLTPREHFLIHKILAMVSVGPAKRKMVNAFGYMAFTSNNRFHNRVCSSRDYELARKLFIEQGFSEERNKKISESRKKLFASGYKQIRTIETKQRHRKTLAEKKAAGIGMSDYQRAAISKGLEGNTNGKGHTVTTEHRLAVSKSRQKKYRVTYPDGTIEDILHLGKWLEARNQIQYPARGQLLKRGRFKGFRFDVKVDT